MADRPRLKTPFDPPESNSTSPAGLPIPPEKRAARGMRFGTKSLFGITFLVAFAAAGYGGVTQGGDSHGFYVIFAIMVPCFALGIASIFHYLNRWRKRKPEPTEQSPWE